MNDDPRVSDESHDVLAQIEALIRDLRYGTIDIVVHDGRVVQIQRKEKFRFPNEARERGRDQRGGDD